ncbi:MAG: PKD domain-containing protein [Flavobacteriales bacterium]|nr:PKD domain-containing protein [Flavobacteriales bacterium]
MNFLFKLITSLFCTSLALFGQAHEPKKLEFVKNLGQWHTNVQHRVAIQNGAVYMEKGCVTYAFANAEEWKKTHDYSQMSLEQKALFSVPAHAWKMDFLGENDVIPAGEEVQNHYYNYFNGNDPSKWASHVPAFHAVKYTELYANIDMRAYSSSNHFKFDFIVKPGADPSQIKYQFSGQDDIQLIDGQLVIKTSVGEFKENRPFAFQIVNGQIVTVECVYKFQNGVVSFTFPSGYDYSRELIIDPELIAATLSGTSVTNYGHSATFDLEGNIYTGCISFGVGYPTTNGAFQENFGGGGTDFGISKLNPEGTDLLWASYVGGSSAETPHSMIANNLQELYVYGSTSSTNFPTVSGCFDTSHNGTTDIVVVKFSVDGSELLGSTYIGGLGSDGTNAAPVNYGDSFRGEIVLDMNQKPIIASSSTSSDFPVTNTAYQSDLAGTESFQDVVVFRLNESLTILEASTFLGSDNPDTGFAIREAANGNIYAAGMAGGENFPVTAGAYQTTFMGDINLVWITIEMDGFVACLDHNLSDLVYSTFYGTENQDQVFFMDLDNDENVYVFGQGGIDMPIIGNVYSNPNSKQFVTKFTPELNDIIVSTQIGSGNGVDEFSGFDFVPVAFLADHCNNIYISSYNAYGTLDLVEPLYSTGGFYLAVLTENLEELEFATMYSENHVDGGTSRFDKNGAVYQGVCSGGGFTTTPDAWATNQPGGWDIGVFKIDFDVSGVNSAISGSDIVGCAPFVVDFTNFSTGDTFAWDFGDGGTSTVYEPSHEYIDPGVYQVSLIATDSLSCNLADTSFFEIVISVPVDYVPDYTYVVDCATQTVECTNTTGYDFLSYLWDMGDGTLIEDMNATHTYTETGTYTITLTAIDEGCLSDSTITSSITIFDEVIAIIGNDDLEGCSPFAVEFENNSGGISYTWDFGDGSPLQTGQNASHLYSDPGEFVVTLYAMGNDDCPGADTTFSNVVVVEPIPIESIFSVLQTDACALLEITTDNQSVGPNLDYQWAIDGIPLASTENISTNLTEPGLHTISLTIFEEACEQSDVSEELIILIDQIDLALEPNAPLCYHDNFLEIQAAIPGPNAEYLWSTEETSSGIVVDQPGIYSVQVTWNNCQGSDTIEVIGIPAQILNEAVTFCEGSTSFLTIPFDGSSNYQWCNGEIGQNISVDQDGQYCYQFVDENGCTQGGTIDVFVHDFMASVYIPNAFTPNNDGINDVFKAEGIDLSEFEMTIWNRWGDEVFKSNTIDQAWTGNVKNTGTYYAQDGVYPYHISYRGICSSEKIEQVGYVIVFR